MNEYRNQAAVATGGRTFDQGLDEVRGKVLRQTYMLLAMTLLFSAAMAGVSMAINAPFGASLVCTLVSMGLLWFVVPRTVNSEAGIWVVFLVTGLLGFGLGPIINHYLGRFANGGQIVTMAFGLTGAIFVSLSAYAIKTRKSFSFMGGMLFTGIMLAFFTSIAVAIAAAFGYYFQPLHLALSAIWVVLMAGMMLYQTGEIVNGGETNYVAATVTLFVSIYNMFANLLHLLGFAMGED